MKIKSEYRERIYKGEITMKKIMVLFDVEKINEKSLEELKSRYSSNEAEVMLAAYDDDFFHYSLSNKGIKEYDERLERNFEAAEEILKNYKTERRIIANYLADKEAERFVNEYDANEVIIDCSSKRMNRLFNKLRKVKGYHISALKAAA